jgi:cytidyltransferase-like protein
MRTIAVYPGRFHPFHKGHAESFKQLASAFGLENTFLAISQKQEQPKSPFSAKDRAKMAVILGIPMNHILFVKNTYSGDEYMQQLQGMGVDVNDTALVLGVSGKDMGTDPRFSFNPKKDGSPSYLQSIDSGVESPMTQHAYIMTTDVAPFNIAGMAMTDASQIRAAYAKGDEELKNQILTDLYGKGSKHVKPIFDQNLALAESIYKKLVLLKQKITESKQLNEFDPEGYEQYTLYTGDPTNQYEVEKFKSVEEAIEEAKFLMNADPRTKSSFWTVQDMDNNIVWSHDPSEAYDLMRRNQKIQFGKGVDEAANPAQQAAIAINMKKNHKKPKNVSESQVVKITDYDTWSDEVKELGGEIYPQKDRNVLIAQSWDGEEIGKFHLGKSMGFINQSGELDETIRKMGSQYRLLSKKGKNLGTFPSKSGAEKHEREVQYFKHMSEDYLDE